MEVTMKASYGVKLSSDCLKVSAYEDGRDGDGKYKLVFKLEHAGHQSYGQSFTVEFKAPVSVAEVPGDVTAEGSGNCLKLHRDNQLNDNGMTEVWVKLSAEGQPEVVDIREIHCQETAG